ncbi:MAG: response regulator transcription factor [Chloroflexi bacterium OHK40]
MSTATTIRIVTIDAHPIFRAGIRQICAAFPDVVVAGEASRCADAIVLCDQLRPTLLLMDGALAGGMSLIAQLRERHPKVGIVILADRIDDSLLRRALELGVVGFLLKHVDPFDLMQALRSAAGGLLTLAPEVASAALARAAQPEREPDALSEREQAVLALLLSGLSNNSIAARLRVSCSTVKFHLRNIYSKLGVSTRAEALATVYAQRRAPLTRSAEHVQELAWRRTLAAVS